MNNSCIRYLFKFMTMILVTWIISCSGKPGKPPSAEKASAQPAEEADALKITIKSPEENSTYKLGSPIPLTLESDSKGSRPDSVAVYFDGKYTGTIKSAPWEYNIPSSLVTMTGRKSVKVTGYRNGKARSSAARFMIILSDIVPHRYGYKIIHTYPHDRNAFTQGLFYDNGYLYEGTGQEAGSTLREVDLTTGKVQRQLNLASNLFGEGITLYKDRIYQVTWTSKVGFVYDKATFKEINKIYYQTQGWGLTTMDDRIVMSDGSNILYICEPEMFTVVSRLEVYDNEKKVDQLNELEYIKGEIWANIWMTDMIARIDPSSGKVLGYIDLKGILNDPEVDTKVNVLNGIAYDKEGGRIFVTGKNWPKLFEIRVTE